MLMSSEDFFLFVLAFTKLYIMPKKKSIILGCSKELLQLKDGQYLRR